MKPLLLKAARAKKGFTQKDVAQHIGITVKSYNEKENGKATFDIEEVNKVKGALELSISDVDEIFFN